MNENKETQTSISKAQTLEEIGEFWDTHSLLKSDGGLLEKLRQSYQ